VRLRGDGSTPLPVGDGSDAWGGMIPWQELPAAENPRAGWPGTANHRTVPAGYPHAYSTYFAASWRYRRMQELLGGEGRLAPADHWAFMRDVHNPLAARIAPLMAGALAAEPGLAALAAILRDWDHRDDPSQVAPTVFQATWREFARLTFEDELGPAVTAQMLESWYSWHERLARLCGDPDGPWFDDVTTPARETRDDLFRRAVRAAAAGLAAELGDDPSRWRWGRVHTVTFSGPLVPGRLAAALLGGGTRPMEGSGEPRYWWFSDAAIA
jgi:penicillin amidase